MNMDYLFDDLKPLQKKHLEMAKYIDTFCYQNNIEWCLAWGSVLGAVRHSGPIPWDDDMDIYMTAEDYAHFKKCFETCGDHDRFYLQEMVNYQGMIPMAKLRMNGTSFIEDVYKDFDVHQGIFVDIFLIHDAPDNWFLRKKQEAADLYLMLKELSNRHYTRRKILVPLMKFLRLFPRDFGYKTAFHQIYRWDGMNTKCYLIENLWRGAKYKFIPKESIFPLKRVTYDGVELPIPGKAEDYLERCYGDWKQIPDIQTIDWKQHTKNWSTTEDFRKFCPNIKAFKDEGNF